MEIGEKIKSLRLSKRMTQTELAGDQITRNMLSLVENGSALPSLPTIIYLSERLNVPAGMLLARESEELVYKKISELPKIKHQYSIGEYKLCLDMCESLPSEMYDDEIYLILSKCCFEIGRENFNHGRLHQCANDFDKACEYCKKTIYGNDQILSSAAIYFDYMSSLSFTLGSEFGNDNYDGEYVLTDPFCRYALAINSFEKGDGSFAKEYAISSGRSDRCFAEHIKAKLDIKNGAYDQAKKRLTKLLNSEELVCSVIMYDIFRDLENCCRETEDFKGAYEYSVGKVDLLEHMLK